jgi:hypothetical protein
MFEDARCVRGGRGTVGALTPFPHPFDRTGAKFMNNIIYIVGLVVIIGFILGYFGLR